MREIKRKAVLSKTMERTAENRVVFLVDIKKKKSRNPHGYWIFQWRKRWDSNPRAREGYLISSQARYDHFDTLPYMLTRHFPDVFAKKKLLERTAKYSVFRTAGPRINTGFSADKTDTNPINFESFSL